MSQHTHQPEPWLYCRMEPTSPSQAFWEPFAPLVMGAGPRIVTGDKGSFLGIHADDYRRICAAVNACAGHTTEELEREHPQPRFIKTLNERDKAIKQRDDLLAATKRFMHASKDLIGSEPDMPSHEATELEYEVVLEAIEEAISKAES